MVNSSLFLRCRYEYVGVWHPKWLPSRLCVLTDATKRPKAADVHEVHNEQAKRCVGVWLICVSDDTWLLVTLHVQVGIGLEAAWVHRSARADYVRYDFDRHRSQGTDGCFEAAQQRAGGI
jgi:hypothetical protein